MSVPTKFILNDADGYWYGPPLGPTEELDYTVDVTGIIGATDSIAGTPSWSASPSSSIIDNARNTTTALTLTVWIKNPPVTTTHTITYTFTSTSGRVVSRSFRITPQQQ